jgi:hypothetical protein
MSAQDRRLRILHTEASLGWGGQEIRVLTEARGVARLGHEVVLAAPADARIAAEAPRFGVELATLPIGRKGPAGVAALRRLLQERRFDVVNTHSSTDTWLTALSCTGLSNAPPIVRTRHISAPVPNNLPTRWLYTRATARIVTTGERLRRTVIEETGVAADRVVSVPTGIDLEHFRPGGDRAAARAQLGLPASSQLVGIVATLRSWKGHRYLLEALAAMTRKGRSARDRGRRPAARGARGARRRTGRRRSRALRGQPGRRGPVDGGLRSLLPAVVRQRGRAPGVDAGDGMRAGGGEHARGFHRRDRDRRGYRRPSFRPGRLRPWEGRSSACWATTTCAAPWGAGRPRKRASALARAAWSRRCWQSSARPRAMGERFRTRALVIAHAFASRLRPRGARGEVRRVLDRPQPAPRRHADAHAVAGQAAPRPP